MTRSQSLVGLAVAGSMALLGGALLFQYAGGLAPCKMCIWQRWPHAIAIVLGLVAWRFRPVAAIAAVVVLVGALIGFYHAGVELSWFEGPTSCTSGPVGDQSPEALLAQILATPLVRCDEIAWSMLGISMAGWNGLLSLALSLVWLTAARAKS